jgi:hypothetical protein
MAATCVDEEEQGADRSGREPLALARPLGRDVTAPERPPVEQGAGDEEPHREQQERRQRPVCHGMAIRRAPDEVDGDKDSKLHDSRVPTRID